MTRSTASVGRAIAGRVSDFTRLALKQTTVTTRKAVMAMKRTKLEDAYLEADAAYRDWCAMREKEYYEKLDAAKQDIRAELEETYGAREAELRSKLMDTQTKHQAELVAIASKNKEYPVGSEMAAWTKTKDCGREWEIIGTGIVEVVTPETQFPRGESNTPGIGRLILRLKKKDGSLGLKYIWVGAWNTRVLPLGETP